MSMNQRPLPACRAYCCQACCDRSTACTPHVSNESIYMRQCLIFESIANHIFITIHEYMLSTTVIYLSGNAKCFVSSSLFVSSVCCSVAAGASVGRVDDGAGRSEVVPEGLVALLPAEPSSFSISVSEIITTGADSGGVEPPWPSSEVSAPT